MLLGHFNKRAMREISSDAPYYDYAISGLGLKYRAHPLGIAFALSQLPSLENWISGKQINANRIRSIISSTPQIVPLYSEYEDRVSAYYAFVLKVDPVRTGFSSSLLERALQAEGFLDIDVPRSTAPLHTLAAFQRPQSPVTTYVSNGLRGDYPVASDIFSQAIKLSVPVEPEGEERSDMFIDAFEQVWQKVVPWMLENPQPDNVQ